VLPFLLEGISYGLGYSPQISLCDVCVKRVIERADFFLLKNFYKNVNPLFIFSYFVNGVALIYFHSTKQTEYLVSRTGKDHI
jgi:hypothetical protein